MAVQDLQVYANSSVVLETLLEAYLDTGYGGRDRLMKKLKTHQSVERCRDVEAALKKMMMDNKTAMRAAAVLLQKNTTLNRGIGMSPNEMLFGIPYRSATISTIPKVQQMYYLETGRGNVICCNILIGMKTIFASFVSFKTLFNAYIDWNE